MAEATRPRAILPPPPEVPVPPAGEPRVPLRHSNERHQRVSEAAYYRAERRGFAVGYELEDWFEAEKEIDASE
jgi:hypothetical protein